MNVDELIARLQRIKREQGGDIPVLINDSHGNTLVIDGAKFLRYNTPCVVLTHEV